MSSGVVESPNHRCSSPLHKEEMKEDVSPNTGNSTATKTDASSYPRWHSVVAGAAAGAAARFATAPLDLLRIRRQLASSHGGDTSEPIGASLLRIAKSEGGIPSLFRGNVAATYLWIGYAAVQFSLYSSTRDFLTACATTTSPTSQIQNSALPSTMTVAFQRLGSHTTAVSFVSGATAGVCATLLTYPFDICRTIFAAQGLKTPGKGKFHPPRTMGEFVIYMHRKQGIRGFFAGSTPALVQIVPYMGLNFAIYEELMKRSDRHGFGNSGMAGAVSGGVSKLLVYPGDTVKKRLQAQAGLCSGTNYSGMLDCVGTMIRQEGVQSLYNGLAPSVLKNMLATGISFACFTLVKDTLATLHDGWE